MSIISLILPEIFLSISIMVLLVVGVFTKHSFNIIYKSSVVVLIFTALLVINNFENLSKIFNDGYVIDNMSNYIKTLSIFSTIIVLLISNDYIKSIGINKFEHPILILSSVVGVMIMVSANDLIIFYMGLELQSLSLYVLAAIDKDSERSTEAGLKYFVLSALSTGLLLYGCSLLYGFTGSTNFELIAQTLTYNDLGSTFGIVFIIVGLAFKVSAVPFHMWTPDVYEGAPIPITTFLSVASKTAAFAALIRISTLIFPNFSQDISWGQVIAIISALSMTLGNFSAILQNSFKRMMAYSTIAHAGYLLIGIAAISVGIGDLITNSISTMTFYLIGYCLINMTAFLSVMCILNTIENDSINKLSGLGKSSPMIAFCLAISMVALTGFPPTIGFIGKLYLFSVGFDSGFDWLILIALLNSVVAAYYYLRVIKVMYLDTSSKLKVFNISVLPKITILSLTILIILFGVIPGPIIDITMHAAESISTFR